MSKSFAPHTPPQSNDARLFSVARSIVGKGRSVLQHGLDDATTLTRRLYPHDQAAAEIVEKGVITLPDSGSLTTFNRAIIDPLADIMGQASAFIQITKRAIPVKFDGAASIFVSGVSASSTNVSFVLKGNATPVQSYDLSTGLTLTSGQQVSTISVFTEETISSSNADVLVKAKVPQDIASGVEKLFFDDVASSVTRPAGSRNDVSRTDPTSGGGTAALAGDLAALGAAVASCGSDIVYAAGPKTALRAKILVPLCPYLILASQGIAENMLIAMSPNALVVASEGEPRIEVSREATLHMDNSASPLSAQGTPNVAAFPVRSVFQTNCVAIKFTFGLTWGWRGKGCSWTDSITW